MAKQDRARWRQFGNEVQRLRGLAGMTQRRLASVINIHHTMLGSIERATRSPQREHADTLDAVLETGGSLRRLWQEIASQRDVPGWFRNAVQLERRAREVREYVPATVPGLLQTPEYARSLAQSRLPRATSDEVDQVVAGRVGRLPVIQEESPLLWFVIRLSVLEQVVTDEKLMYEQLLQIVRLVEEGVIRMQVLPRTPEIASPGTPFRVLTLTDLHAVAYVEHALGGETYDAPEQVSDLMTLFGALQAEALSPSASVSLIREINGEKYGHVA